MNKQIIQEKFMKKIYTLSLFLIFTACLFTGCIIAPDDFSNNSNIKYKAWKQTEGYMVKEEGSEERHFVAWSSSIQDKSHQAMMYEHEYIKSPYTVLYVQEWDKDNIEYKTVSNTKNNSFTITNKPVEKNGFIFYTQDDNIYIINTLYNSDTMQRKLRIHDDKYSKADYRFKIEVDGINDPIIILMDETGGWE